MNIKPKYYFILLSLAFIVYSFSIYLKPLHPSPNSNFSITEASEGRLVWQKYNCQSCHQLYSLGGYLGPDLTNVISQPGKGKDFLKAMLHAGYNQMPVFQLSNQEINQLYEFLKSIDASGTADPRKLKVNNYGMIERNEN